MRKVLVTGCEGFLGKHLCKELSARGTGRNKIYGLDKHIVPLQMPIDGKWTGSITDMRFLKRLLLTIKVDCIIHLAAEAIVRNVQSSPLRGFQVNIMGTANILEAARLFDIDSVIIASSDKAYGDQKVPYLEETPLLGCYPYDVSKACADMLARSYYRTYGLKTCVTRCSNIYGPGDLNFSRLIPYTIKCLVEGTSPQFHSGTGNVYREYTYVDDIVDAYILLAERINDVKGKAYNVGSGFKATRDEVVTKIFDLMGKPPNLELVPAGFEEIKDQYLDSERIRELGWQPKIDFEEGLRRTISWYKEYLG